MEVTTRSNTPFQTGNETADAALNKASSKLHGAVDKVAAAADEAARKVTPAIDRAAELAHQSVDKAVGVAAPTATWLNEQGNSLVTSQRTLASDAEQYVSAHPWKSLGIALVTGVLIGRIVR